MRKIFIAIVCAFVACTAILPAVSADWPQFRGPEMDGISKDKLPNVYWNVKPPKLLWKLDFNDDSFSGPSVVGNRVFIVTHVGTNDVVKCINLRNGATIWENSYPNAGAPNFGYTRSTPSVKGDKLLTLSRWGVVICLNSRNGKLIWSRDLVKEFGGSLPEYGHAASPLIDGNKVIVCPGGKDASVAALDIETGKTIWAGGGSDPTSYSTPVKAKIQDRWQYVVFSEGFLKGVDAADGKLLWQYPFKSSADSHGGTNIPSPIVIGNSVFISTSYNMGSVMLDISEEQKVSERWKNKALMALVSTPILLNGYIYGIGDPELLVCLDAKDGTKKWDAPGFEKGPVIAVDGYLICQVGNTGELVLVRPTPSKYTEIARMPTFGRQCWTAPVYSGGFLLVRDIKSFACYDMR